MKKKKDLFRDNEYLFICNNPKSNHYGHTVTNCFFCSEGMWDESQRKYYVGNDDKSTVFRK